MTTRNVLIKLDIPRGPRERAIFNLHLKAQLEDIGWKPHDCSLLLHVKTNRLFVSSGGATWQKFLRCLRSVGAVDARQNVQCGGCWITQADAEDPWVNFWLKDELEFKED